MRCLSGLSLCVFVALSPAASGKDAIPVAGPTTQGWRGQVDGVWLWALPDTPNGLKPTQSWHATGSSPDGSIYIAGMDHATNAALYRLDSARGVLRYVGDARSASEAAANWKPGETAEKFHTRPLWYQGRVYVATMDRSELDDAYLQRRGFHWYAYDPARDSFQDLSAKEPGGTGDIHENLVSLASDPVHNVVYGAGVPTGDIYRYDVASGRTEKLGRPRSYDLAYVYTGRVMWVDPRGRLYFTAGDPSGETTTGHVHYYDPATGFGEKTDWTLQNGQALEVGQCLAGGRRCFFSDDAGHVYSYDDAGPSWTHIGRIKLSEAETPRRYIWAFDVTPDGRTAYMATSTSPQWSDTTSLYEFDLENGATTRLCAIGDIDPALRHMHVHTGYDAWDAQGRFYFASFNGDPRQPVILTRVDPVRLKAALGQPGSPADQDRAPGSPAR